MRTKPREREKERREKGASHYLRRMTRRRRRGGKNEKVARSGRVREKEGTRYAKSGEKTQEGGERERGRANETQREGEKEETEVWESLHALTSTSLRVITRSEGSPCLVCARTPLVPSHTAAAPEASTRA